MYHNNKCWFAENLNVGDSLDPFVQQQNPDNDTIEKYCNNCLKYGGFYLWEEAMNGNTNDESQGICPEGWHIPSMEELEYMIFSLESSPVLIIDGLIYTPELLYGGSSGFDIRMAGYYKNMEGDFVDRNNSGVLFTSSMSSENLPYLFEINSSGGWKFYTHYLEKGGKDALSIRCVKDGIHLKSFNIGEISENYNNKKQKDPKQQYNIDDEDIGCIIYPNPAKDYLTIKIKNYNGKLNVVLYNTTGLKMAEYNLLKTTDIINLGNMPSGLYIMEIKAKDKMFIEKLIIR